MRVHRKGGREDEVEKMCAVGKVSTPVERGKKNRDRKTAKV